MNWRYIISGFLILFAVAYLDCGRGPLLPFFQQAMVLNYTEVSLFLVTGYLIAIGVNFLLFPILKRFHERKVAIGAGVFAIAVFGTSFFVNSYLSLLAISILYGGVIAVGQALCNLLTAQGVTPILQSRYLCGLHLMYALGALITPLATRVGFERYISWQWIWGAIPTGVFLILIAILATTQVEPEPIEPNKPSKKLSTIQVVLLLAFCFYVSAEVGTSMWLVSYLVDTQSFSLGKASYYLAGFFAAMFLGRLVCFVSLKEKYEAYILQGCILFGAGCFLLGHWGYLWAFSLAGFMGPYFPILLSRVKRHFPEQWRSLAVWVVLSIQVTLAILHLLMGWFNDQIGIHNAFLIPLVFFFLTLTLLRIYFEWEKKAQVRRGVS